MIKTKNSRRTFIKKSLKGSTIAAAGGILPGFDAKSYNRILGANERFLVSVMGVNSRGRALAQNFAQQENCDVIHICDVDERAIESCLTSISDRQDIKAKGFKDFRKSLDSPDLDMLVVAAPDHWHAPATLLAMQAGKHVYLEKPCSHNPKEGELLIQASKHFDRKIQMGNQRRSWPNVQAGIQALHDGKIGRVYFGKGWYSNNRASIGVGKENRRSQMARLEFMARSGPTQKF